MQMFDVDDLKIYRGSDIPITDKIFVTQPTIDQIIEFGEKRYFSSVHTLTSVGADFKWQLWDYFNTDYTKIDDFDLFKKMICGLLSSKKKIYEELKNNPEQYEEYINKMTDEDWDELLFNPLSLVLKDIDLADFEEYESDKHQETILYDKEHDITIDRLVYSGIVDAVRKIHGFKRNNETPANEMTKMDLIDDARDDSMMASMKPYRSTLKSYISAFAIKCGMCANDDNIWNMNIGMFLDGIKRISKIRDADSLLQGAYSGFANLKGVDQTRFDWAGDI
jgi:hypothetical protein